MPSFEIFKDEVKRYSDKQTISATEKNLFTAFDEFVKVVVNATIGLMLPILSLIPFVHI
nr:hypothetical protein [Myroides odoratimimus]